MQLFTDSGTGCQYLGYQPRFLTPRMGPDGKQVCKPELRRKD